MCGLKMSDVKKMWGVEFEAPSQDLLGFPREKREADRQKILDLLALTNKK